MFITKQVEVSTLSVEERIELAKTATSPRLLTFLSNDNIEEVRIAVISNPYFGYLLSYDALISDTSSNVQNALKSYCRSAFKDENLYTIYLLKKFLLNKKDASKFTKKEIDTLICFCILFNHGKNHPKLLPEYDLNTASASTFKQYTFIINIMEQIMSEELERLCFMHSSSEKIFANIKTYIAELKEYYNSQTLIYTEFSFIDFLIALGRVWFYHESIIIKKDKHSLKSQRKLLAEALPTLPYFEKSFANKLHYTVLEAIYLDYDNFKKILA